MTGLGRRRKVARQAGREGIPPFSLVPSHTGRKRQKNSRSRQTVCRQGHHLLAGI